MSLKFSKQRSEVKEWMIQAGMAHEDIMHMHFFGFCFFSLNSPYHHHPCHTMRLQLGNTILKLTISNANTKLYKTGNLAR